MIQSDQIPVLPAGLANRDHQPAILIQDHLCVRSLELAARKTGSISGFLTLLTSDGKNLQRWYAYKNHKVSQVADLTLAKGWQMAMNAGAPIRTRMGIRAPSSLLVPIFSGSVCCLVVGLFGKFLTYTKLDTARIVRLGQDLWSELQQAREISQIEEAYEGAIRAWARAIEDRERGIHLNHFDQAAELAANLAREIGLNEVEIGNLRRGAILHDIGKMSIPEEILCKQGSLTPEEWEHIRKHPMLGAAVISEINYLQPSIDVILCHHERWDGAGYPRGLKGTDIPLSARIFAVVDVWDALICDLPYRPAWPREMALSYIRQQAGRQFDPDVVKAFVRIIPRLITG